MGATAPGLLTVNGRGEATVVHCLSVNSADLRPTDWASFRDARRTVMAIFPDDIATETTPARERAGILWRVDPSANGDVVRIQSIIEPLHVPSTAIVKQEFIGPLHEDTLVSFETVVNGVVRSGNHARPILADEEIESFVAKRTGMDLAHLSLHTTEVQLPDPVARGGRRAAFATRGHVLHKNRVVGAAVVRDSNALVKARLLGVGRSKAFGCGLLTVTPIAVASPLPQVVE